LRWGTVVEQKTTELSRFLTGKSLTLDFLEAAPDLRGQDNAELRGKILILNSSHARQIDIAKGTLHYLCMNVKSNVSFRVYRGVGVAGWSMVI